MRTNQIDCHFHTTKSDGMYTPEQAVAEAKKAGLVFAACTNHDLIDREMSELLLDSGIDSVPAVEISACDYAKDSDGGDKSLHITAFSRAFGAEEDAVMEGIRQARVTKVRGQVEKLSGIGFDIQWAGLCAYWITKGLGIENMSNSHLRAYLFSKDDPQRSSLNSARYLELTGRPLDFWGFIKRHLGRDSQEPFGYYDTPKYEPGYATLADIRQRTGAVLSIAHPNWSFDREGIEEFERRALRALDQGAINAIEIHSSTPPVWIEKILEIRNRTGILLTFGSDCHFQKSHDGKHSWLGELNPHVDANLVAEEFDRFYQALR